VTDTMATPAPAAGRDLSLLARIAGIYFSPEETFRAVVARPRWFGVMLLTLVIGAGCQYLIMSSPELQDAMIDQQIRRMESGGTAASDEQIAGIERMIGLFPQIYPVATFFIGPLFVAAIAGILVGVFTTLMGGQGTFRQMFAVLTHSGLISMLSGIFSAALVAAGVPPSGVRPPGANLGVFVPMLEEGSFLLTTLQSIDLILVWWLIVLAMGVGVLYKRRPGGIAAAFIGIYLVIALIIGTFTSGS
jgi:hypothetical protein